jgi:ABC-type nitrate/sulfonate/bicarbonate transport system substrate-binding protein
VLKYTDAGVNLYGNAILASNALITQQPRLVAAFLRATNRAIQETLADPLPRLQPPRRANPS